MLEKTITVTLPQITLQRLEETAIQTQRSVDELLTQTIEAMFVSPSTLPSDWSALHLMSDKKLWKLFQAPLSDADQTRLHTLNHLAGERTLTESESAEQSALLERYQQAVLRRAQAMAVLKLRGHQISLTNPSSPNG